MTKQLQPGDLALVVSGVLLGESVELLAYVKPGEAMIIDGREMNFHPEEGRACWQVMSKDAWAMKAPGTLMPLGSALPQQHNAWEATE
jgi:hypothetical protein